MHKLTPTAQFDDPAEARPTSFRALDFAPSSDALGAAAGGGKAKGQGAGEAGGQGGGAYPSILVGTPCELWEVPGVALAPAAAAAAAQVSRVGCGGWFAATVLLDLCLHPACLCGVMARVMLLLIAL